MSEHWDRIYTEREPSNLSWSQSTPVVSLDLISMLGVPREAAVVDVGGGTSTLVQELGARGFNDLSVLDISEVALTTARRRLRADAQVRWLHADVLNWQPERRYGLWHDRAAFHFLVSPADQDAYLRVMSAALTPDGAVVLATFAPGAPPTCSGLPVVRRTAADLIALLAPGFRLFEERNELHTTPGGTPQPFTWIAGRF